MTWPSTRLGTACVWSVALSTAYLRGRRAGFSAGSTARARRTPSRGQDGRSVDVRVTHGFTFDTARESAASAEPSSSPFPPVASSGLAASAVRSDVNEHADRLASTGVELVTAGAEYLGMLLLGEAAHLLEIAREVV